MIPFSWDINIKTRGIIATGFLFCNSLIKIPAPSIISFVTFIGNHTKVKNLYREDAKDAKNAKKQQRRLDYLFSFALFAVRMPLFFISV